MLKYSLQSECAGMENLQAGLDRKASFHGILPFLQWEGIMDLFFGRD
jgi:hypothetical protein